MNKLEYHVDCLDGVYDLTAEFSDAVTYSVDTDIASLKSFSGELDADTGRIFMEEIEKAQIERWDREYAAYLSKIEDGIRWEVRYLKGEEEYVSKGEESYTPYGFEHLVKAVLICDKDSEYLF